MRSQYEYVVVYTKFQLTVKNIESRQLIAAITDKSSFTWR